jgi:hypothetical protein
MKKGLFIIAAALIFLSSCKKGEELNPNTVRGTVSGTVYSANRNKTIAFAKVSIEGSDTYQTYSDNQGRFTLECPAGRQHIIISTGSGNIFRCDFFTEVSGNTNREAPADSTVLEQTKRIAYVAGMFDSIQNIIVDSLGYTVDELTDVDLYDRTTLDSFAIIFLNCGAMFSMNHDIYINLDQYLDNGGNIYASDYAIDYLVGDGTPKRGHSHSSGDIHKTACMNPVLGGFIDDSLLCHTKYGNMGVINGATVLDPDMQTIFGSTIDINYNLGSWAVLNHVETGDPRFKVLINDGSTGYGPLLAGIHWGTGATGGNIMYTTFHNEANVTTDMVEVLQYVILNY